jgi:hypothetical protein
VGLEKIFRNRSIQKIGEPSRDDTYRCAGNRLKDFLALRRQTIGFQENNNIRAIGGMCAGLLGANQRGEKITLIAQQDDLLTI